MLRKYERAKVRGPFPRSRNLSVFSLVLVGILAVGLVGASPVGNFWTERKAAPAPIFLSSAAVVNNVVYVIGGSYAVTGATPLPSNMAYDPGSDSWKTLAGMPTIRQTLGVVAVGERIYAIGGDSAVGISSKNEVYNTTTDSWRTMSPIPVPTTGSAIAAVNSTVYVMGGINSNGNTLAVWAYDTLSDSWSQRSNMPSALPNTGGTNVAAPVIGGKIYVVPRNAWQATTSLVYDVGKDSWTDSWAGPPFTNDAGTTVSIYFYSMTALGTKIFVIGGTDTSSRQYTRASPYNFQYDIITKEWTRGQDMPTSRDGPVTANVQGLIYVMGGGGNSCDTTGPSGACVANEAYTPGDIIAGSSPAPSQSGLPILWIAAGLILTGIGVGGGLGYYLRNKGQRSRSGTSSSLITIVRK